MLARWHDGPVARNLSLRLERTRRDDEPRFGRGAARCHPRCPPGCPNLPSTDPFAVAALDSSWSILHPEYASITTGAGKLTIEMKAKAIWAGPNEAVHVWKRVSGNFRATAQVSARGVASPDTAPRGPVRLGGLMARSTASLPRQNYVHVVVGFAPTGLSVETKTTLDNATTFDAPVWPTADAEVRICRLGQMMTLLKRSPSGGPWQTAATFDRGDLPAELAVGPNAYAQYGAGGPPSDAGPADASRTDAGPELGRSKGDLRTDCLRARWVCERLYLREVVAQRIGRKHISITPMKSRAEITKSSTGRRWMPNMGSRIVTRKVSGTTAKVRTHL
jgi:hypothetical protein